MKAKSISKISCILILCLTSCKDTKTTSDTKSDTGLTREMAKNLIVGPGQPGLGLVLETIDFGPCRVTDESYGVTSPKYVALLEQSGLVKVLDSSQLEEWPNKGQVIDNTYLLLTEEGNRYVISSEPWYGGDIKATVAMARRHNIEITGIGEPSQMGGKTVSMVTFKYEYQALPFGRVFEEWKNEPNLYTGLATGVGTFALYDDGWRFESWERQ